MAIPPIAERHVHFPPDQVSGSHNPPAAFQRSANATASGIATAAGNAADTATGIASGIAGEVRNAAAQLLNTVADASARLRARLHGLSQEVPFERWFFHYGLEQNFSDAQLTEKIAARGWALLSLAESVVRGVAAIVQHCFAKIFDSMPTTESLNMLRAQWHSIRLSCAAIVSPEDAIIMATTKDEDNERRMGRLLLDGNAQGTPYPAG